MMVLAADGCKRSLPASEAVVVSNLVATGANDEPTTCIVRHAFGNLGAIVFDVANVFKEPSPPRVARSQDAFIRQAAIHALRAFRDPASFSVLVDALDDPDRYIRYNRCSHCAGR